MIKTVKRLFGMMTHLLPKVSLAVSFAVLGFIMTVMIPAILVVLTFEVLQTGQINTVNLVLLIVLSIVRGICRYGEHYFGHDVAFMTLADFRGKVYRQLRRLSPSKLDQQNSGALLKMIGEDIEALEVFFAHTIPPVFTAIIIFIGLLVYYSTVDFGILAIASVVYLLLSIVIPYDFANRMTDVLAQQFQMKQIYHSYFLENLKTMYDLLQYHHIDNRVKQLDQYSQKVNKIDRQLARIQLLQTSLTFLVVGLGIIAVGFRLLTLEYTDTMQKIIALVVFSSSPAPFLELSRLPLGLKRAINAGKHVLSLLDEEFVKDETTGTIKAIHEIQLSDVTFTYETREDSCLKNVNEVFKEKQIIGIIGESGSGKSTLMKLLMKWYIPTEGRITINGVDTEQLNSYLLQSRFAYIPQVSQLFSQTLRDNLTLGDFISDNEILTVLEKCQLMDCFNQLPEGLDTMINSDKNPFSAGELQRLEVARALLKNSDCYIFDEPTSHLDSLNEAILLDVIREHCKGLVFIISHRMSTMSFADKVYRVQDGQLFEL